MTTSPRRPMGSLESAVLSALWRADEPQTPGQVLETIDADVAYTTVMTILARLWQKGLAERFKQGRAYAYAPAMSEADLAASKMRDQLSQSSDRMATIGRFVSSLDPAEARQLRKLLERPKK
jgi:predicted transcriptional regulator